MLNSLPRDWKKCDTNSGPRSDVTCNGAPCFEKTCERNKQESSGEVMESCIGMKRECLVSQSTTTRMDEKLSDSGSCSMKSIEMESHGCVRIGSCLSNP